MTTFSYLDYLDNFSEDSRIRVFQQSQLNYHELSEITGFTIKILKKWFSKSNPKFSVGPAIYSWNLAMYKLEARLKGYASLTAYRFI